MLKLQNAARIQEKLKSERIAAIDKHPYKDIDETFLVKLDDILGVNEYKINQCVYKIDYESDTISSYQIKELKSVFGESKLEIKDRNDKISIYVTQNIEPVPSNRNADNYISALNGFCCNCNLKKGTIYFHSARIKVRRFLTELRIISKIQASSRHMVCYLTNMLHVNKKLVRMT